MQTIPILGAIFLLGGVAFGWFAVRRLAVLPRLLRADVVGPSSVSSDAEFVVCRGRAESTGETLAAPFTGERCLGLEYEVSERELTPSEIPLSWTKLDDGVATVPFELSDDYGRVRVAPESRRFRLDADSETLTVAAGDDPPERIRSFLEARGEISPTSGGVLSTGSGLPVERIFSVFGVGTRRYTERRIALGEECVVAGRPAHEDGSVAVTDPVVIADRSPRGVAAARLQAAAFPIVAAVAFLAVGAGLLAIA